MGLCGRIEGLSVCVEGLRDYQFRQTSLDTFEILAEVSDKKRQEAVRLEMMKQMTAILQEKHLSYVQFYILFVDKILPDLQTGKKALIIKLDLQERRTAV